MHKCLNTLKRVVPLTVCTSLSMYSVFEPSITISIINLFESYTIFYLNTGLTYFFFGLTYTILLIDQRNATGSLVTDLLDCYATVFSNQALLVEWLIFTFLLEYIYVGTLSRQVNVFNTLICMTLRTKLPKCNVVYTRERLPIYDSEAVQKKTTTLTNNLRNRRNSGQSVYQIRLLRRGVRNYSTNMRNSWPNYWLCLCKIVCLFIFSAILLYIVWFYYATWLPNAVVAAILWVWCLYQSQRADYIAASLSQMSVRHYVLFVFLHAVTSAWSTAMFAAAICGVLSLVVGSLLVLLGNSAYTRTILCQVLAYVMIMLVYLGIFIKLYIWYAVVYSIIYYCTPALLLLPLLFYLLR